MYLLDAHRSKTLKWHFKFFARVFIDFFDLITQKEEISLLGERKKILIFNWRDIKHRYSGGAEVYIYELAKRWVKLGNTVTLFCGNDGKSKTHEIVDGITVVRRGGFYFVYIWAFLYYILKFRNKYDVIIDCQNGIPFFTPLYAKKTKYCLMFHVHQNVFRKTLIKPLAWFASFLENGLMPLVYKKIKFITISDSSKKDIKRLNLGKAGIEIVHPGVDTKTLRPRKRRRKLLILYLGRLKLYKNVKFFIYLAQRVLREIPELEFIIAGDGEEKSKLKKIVNQLNLEGKIKFLGRVTEEEKIRLYQKSYVFVNPSLMEGWGITTIEANACGVPVIASDVPGLRDSVNNPETGFLAESNNINDFTYKTLLILKNKRLRDKMSVSARKWSEKFNWQNSAEKFLELMK
ncbi:MAG: glycosyltransferase family 4 protein [Patescibacteria group bacterium]|nr:glycosyltransferase family 4 protein [Patescibacteria group bacterium]